MKKVLKGLGIIVIILIVVGAGALAYVKLMLPNVGKAPELKVQVTPERVERGKYLANSVTVCIDCHSKRDWSQYGGPIIPGTEGGGGEVFDRKMGFPGVFYSRNITPYNLGNWTDGEIYRVITTGVNKNNEAIFPVMPYHHYGELDNEDIYSIIAYLRTLPPIKNEIPQREIDFKFSIILNTIPTKANPAKRPAQDNAIAYGGYLVKAAACVECHTKFENGQLVAGTEFGGGREFELPGGTLRTANISPDETGLGFWSKEKFISTFKAYTDSNYHSPKVAETDFNTIMPWMMYGRMSTNDLSCIYDYLKTVTPIKNTVTKFTPRALTAVN